MNRRHSAEDYFRLVERIRAARPDMAFSGDFIVGFPGETEADFAETLALVEAVGYAQAYSFAYSARPGTPAAGRPGVPEAEKSERLHRLQALLLRQQTAFQSSQVGQTLPILIEKPGREAGQMSGRSPYLNAVHLLAPAELSGRIVPVEIVATSSNSLAGRLASA
jgi:tRNA-2-methylthio-N6-dimethylallyladenosine synthase